MKQDPDFFSCIISPTLLIRMFHKRKTLLIKNHRMFHKRKTLLIKNHIYRLYCCPKGTTLFSCRHIHTHIYHRDHETLFHEPSKQILHPGPSLRHSLSRICCASRPYLDYTITSQSALSCRISLGPYQPDMPWPIKFFLILTSVPSC